MSGFAPISVRQSAPMTWWTTLSESREWGLVSRRHHLAESATIMTTNSLKSASPRAEQACGRTITRRCHWTVFGPLGKARWKFQ